VAFPTNRRPVQVDFRTCRVCFPVLSGVNRYRADVFMEQLVWAPHSCYPPSLSSPSPMPMPKFFTGSSSRGHASENDSRTDTPANDNSEFASRTTITPGIAIPEYSDSLRDAWTAAHRELPQAKGTEKILNKIGALTMIYPHAPSSGFIFHATLTFSGKKVSRVL
jgi:hypothetical protein